jgi:hypothetical protein
MSAQRWWRRAPLLSDTPPSWPPVRHPMQVFLMAASVESGILGLLITDTPPSLSAALGYVLLTVWQLTLLISGLLGLAAAFVAHRDGLWSMLLERVALFAVGPMALVYAFVVTSASWPASTFAASITGGYGLACIARLVQLQRTLNWMRWAGSGHEEVQR